MTGTEGRVRVFLVEDNPGDVYLIKLALSEHRLECDVIEATDGRAALVRIRDGTTEAPDVAILDLNLPFHSGREILQAIRAQPSWSKIPVIVFTSSSSPVDRAEMAALGATLFLNKPSSLDEFLEIGGRIRNLI